MGHKKHCQVMAAQYVHANAWVLRQGVSQLGSCKINPFLSAACTAASRSRPTRSWECAWSSLRI